MTITSGITIGVIAIITTTDPHNMVTIQPAMKPVVWSMVVIIQVIKITSPEETTTRETATTAVTQGRLTVDAVLVIV